MIECNVLTQAVVKIVVIVEVR